MNCSTTSGEPRQWRMVVLVITGIVVILFSQAAYMEVFSYSVVTRNIENGILHVDVTYVDPISSFFPVFLVIGIVITAFGLWKSRRALSMHRRAMLVGLLAGTTLSLLSTVHVQHQLSTGPNDYYNYGFPLPWLINIIIQIPVQRSIWVPALEIFDDLLFWTALGYLGLLLAKRLGRLGW